MQKGETRSGGEARGKPLSMLNYPGTVVGAGDVEERSYSVICEDRGQLEPLSGPNEVNAGGATAYQFVFDDDWELGTVLLAADQNMVYDWQVVVYDDNTHLKTGYCRESYSDPSVNNYWDPNQGQVSACENVWW